MLSELVFSGFNLSWQVPSTDLEEEGSVKDMTRFDDLKPEIKLSDNTFQFPKCQIR
jgi:hypothetical protein